MSFSTDVEHQPCNDTGSISPKDDSTGTGHPGTAEKTVVSTSDKKDASQEEAEGDEEGHHCQQKQEQYSVFTVNQKRAMIATGSLASFFSPLSSSIYFPALDTIARKLDVSITRIDLTVTTYLVSFVSYTCLWYLP